MYKPTIWQDHVEGVQEGTDMNAANFNNLEVGTMEANALAALNAAHRRYATDVAKNSEMFVFEGTITQGISTITIPNGGTRNTANYIVFPVPKEINNGTAGDIIISEKGKTSFKAKYNGTAAVVTAEFHIMGGMI